MAQCNFNMTDMEIRLSALEQTISQEKLMRQNVEKQLENATKLLYNTSLVMQEERKKRTNLEKKLEDTISLLSKTTQQLHDERTLRILLQRDMENKFVNVNDTFQFIFNQTNARFSDIELKLQNNSNQLQQLWKNFVAEEKNITNHLATKQSLQSLAHDYMLLSHHFNALQSAVASMNLTLSGEYFIKLYSACGGVTGSMLDMWLEG